jgi:hypothetical protein
VLFRLEVTNGGKTQCLPDAEGVNKYIYEGYNRLEEIVIQCVAKLPKGNHQVQLQVKLREQYTKPYYWNSAYGETTLIYF